MLRVAAAPAAAPPGRATSPALPARSISAGKAALLRAASPRALSRSNSQVVGRRKVLRWLNDQVVWGLAASGGADDDPEALVQWMLLRPGEGAAAPFAMSPAQREAFFHGEEEGGGEAASGGDGRPAPAPRPAQPQLTVKGVLLGCWGRVADARKKRVVLKEAARAAALLGGEGAFRPWLLDCEALCQRLLDGRACAPGAGEGGLCAWEAGAEARSLLLRPLAAAEAVGGGGAPGVQVACASGIARLLLAQVAAFYGLKVVESAAAAAGEGGAEQEQAAGGASAGAGALAAAPRLLLLFAAPFNTAGPSPAAMRAAREALWPAWAETVADAGLQAEGVPQGADGPGTPIVPLLFIHAANIHENS